MKKIFVSGLIAGALLVILSIALLYFILWLLPDMALEYFGPAFISQAYRNALFYIHPFVIAIGLSWLWAGLQDIFKGPPLLKSLKFGLVYVAIATFPYMLLIYSAIDVSSPVILTWLAFGFIEATIVSIIFNTLDR